jgi:hypothetical protein
MKRFVSEKGEREGFLGVFGNAESRRRKNLNPAGGRAFRSGV